MTLLNGKAIVRQWESAIPQLPTILQSHYFTVPSNIENLLLTKKMPIVLEYPKYDRHLSIWVSTTTFASKKSMPFDIQSF